MFVTAKTAFAGSLERFFPQAVRSAVQGFLAKQRSKQSIAIEDSQPQSDNLCIYRKFAITTAFYILEWHQ
ncbi:hypothetical protein QUB68_29600 [Microcoleus sp. A006_D1]|uniref:hypothetical protein n=1 Tax=Microcoleus sp. A006_D1 TaxID=3055267 RepID=UPI002FD72D5B